jgi:WhiB family transcriptional regulator, redox-sensing transcriptional regulator
MDSKDQRVTKTKERGEPAMTLAFALLPRTLPDASKPGALRPDRLRTSAVPAGPTQLGIELDNGLPCRQYDPDLWFAESPADLEVAKALCGSCPIKAECLAGAIERAEPWGVWGGEIFERGAVIPRKRPRGRPRKVDVARDAALRVEAELVAPDQVAPAAVKATAVRSNAAVSVKAA